MNCPACGSQARVLESRPADNGSAVRRRRLCPACEERFTTYERFERGPLFVRKRDGARERFDRAKLKRALARATHKRPVTEAQIDAIVGRVESELSSDAQTQQIVEICLDGLAEFDVAGAYLQFAGTLN